MRAASDVIPSGAPRHVRGLVEMARNTRQLAASGLSGSRATACASDREPARDQLEMAEQLLREPSEAHRSYLPDRLHAARRFRGPALLGVDGGNTKTQALVTDVDGNGR